MPRIPDQLTRDTVFMYVSENDARKDSGYGGTGFIVEESSAPGLAPFRYLVTNSHVALGGATTMRKVEDGVELVRNFEPGLWRHHPTQDLSMVRVTGPRDSQPFVSSGLSLEDVLGSAAQMKEQQTALNIGIGDDVLMPGRFIQLERNEMRPVMRFGNLSLFPEARLRGGNGLMTEAYLAEMRSQSGDSGSPVFVYVGPFSSRGNGEMMPAFSEAIGLLGIVTGHVDFKQADALVVDGEHAWSGSYAVKYNTAMAIICPSYRLRELLDLEENVEEREQEILEAESLL